MKLEAYRRVLGCSNRVNTCLTVPEIHETVTTKTLANTHSVVRSGKGFAAKAHLDSHILNNHIDNVLLMKSITNKIHSCPHCDYKAIITSHINDHMKKHKFYNRHLNIHYEIKPLGCSVDEKYHKQNTFLPTLRLKGYIYFRYEKTYGKAQIVKLTDTKN
nr:unnamed protein product [Callosobruchus analis]